MRRSPTIARAWSGRYPIVTGKPTGEPLTEGPFPVPSGKVERYCHPGVRARLPQLQQRQGQLKSYQRLAGTRLPDDQHAPRHRVQKEPCDTGRSCADRIPSGLDAYMADLKMCCTPNGQFRRMHIADETNPPPGPAVADSCCQPIGRRIQGTPSAFAKRPGTSAANPATALTSARTTLTESVASNLVTAATATDITRTSPRILRRCCAPPEFAWPQYARS